MPSPADQVSASASASLHGDTLHVVLGGTWKITATRPAWSAVLGTARPARVKIEQGDAVSWDSSLLLFLFEAEQWCRATEATLDSSALPKQLRDLLTQIVAAQGKERPVDRAENPISLIGLAVFGVWTRTKQLSHFVGECTLATFRLGKNPARFRWLDCVREMQQCGAMALPIVGLIGMLVGLTLAYTAAVLLRQFGADIYVANFVGLVMVREMGPMMTGIILAGRTGAAFAATLGNMKAGEEIDAYETFGIRSVDFLVLPRLLAVTIMTPLLALYSNMLGIIGGLLVAAGILKIPASAYWVQTQAAIDLSDVASGLVKALVFGGIVGLSGCLRGLQSERSAIGVGNSTTSAVVTAILLLVSADAVFAVIFNALGI